MARSEGRRHQKKLEKLIHRISQADGRGGFPQNHVQLGVPRTCALANVSTYPSERYPTASPLSTNRISRIGHLTRVGYTHVPELDSEAVQAFNR